MVYIFFTCDRHCIKIQNAVDLFGRELLWEVFSLIGFLPFYTVIRLFYGVFLLVLYYYHCILVGGLRMIIGVSQRRIRKKVGKTKMSVGVIAYYNLMQVCQAEYFRQLLKPVT
ncbi:hypothetical protein R6Q59_017049 [Mikania micrantha]